MSTPAESPTPLGNLVAAHFQRVEVVLLGRILATTLAGALPASMLGIELRRTLTDRVTGREGDVIGVSIHAAGETLTFRAPAIGEVEASVAHTVRGVTLSRRTVTVVDWLDHLAGILNKLAAEDEAARLALERALR
ncbi:MAG: hypothetical protein ACR2LX_17660 [Jatrophihabitans sp.]